MKKNFETVLDKLAKNDKSEEKTVYLWVVLTITPPFLISIIIVFELHFCPSAASIYNFENETPNKKIDHCHCEFYVKL